MLYFKNKRYILMQTMVIYLSKGLPKTLMELLKTLMELFKTLMELLKTLMELVQTRYITGVLHVGEIFVIQSTLICYISYMAYISWAIFELLHIYGQVQC